MLPTREAIETYIRAKDGNRPFLMASVFAEDCTLEIVVRLGTIAFPPITRGLEAISDTLIRRFAEVYENVYTFCLGSPPNGSSTVFSCNWLVAMSEKGSRNVRVGCGRYEWRFQSRAPGLAERLLITIDHMETLAPIDLVAVLRWVSQLAYPWCAPQAAMADMPRIESLRPIRRALELA